LLACRLSCATIGLGLSRRGAELEAVSALVSLALCEYAISGYQVAEKWLKDRRDRGLTLEEVRTYRRILTALARTIEVQADIDDLCLAVEAKPATVAWA